ncbi:MAG: hypothetical protein DRQ57_17465 [Gammaproteobacteria bacterium]|nr:MAG: hypothetical protein DRQ57_17465 [Gammaproteobacteria bacterium]
MNAKNLSIFAIFTLVLVIAAIMLTHQDRAPTISSFEKEAFFPNLENVINDVTEIDVSNQSESITLLRVGENWQWLIKEKHLYPASLDKVHKLLLGVVHLTILDAKTNNQDRYAEIGVEDVLEEGAKSVLLTFKKSEGEIVASLIVGHDRVAKVDSTRREIYIRKPDEKQAWLTLGQLPIEKTAKDWLEPQIVNLDGDNVRQVSVTHPDGEHLVVFKDSPDDEDYQLADLPENAQVKLPYMLNNIATTLTRLDLDDVTTDSEFEDDATIRAVFTTFDGLEVTMLTTEKGGKHYAQFTAAFNPASVFVEPTDDETDEEPQNVDAADSEELENETVDVKKQAEQLNTQFKGWVYELSKYKVDDLANKRDDLISVEEAPAKEIILEAIEEELPYAYGTPSTTE